ncbi:TolC family protein [Alloacidobacterium sp.]|uniref:TolC family protein n=1 Tax=Alloacidobacterium sp. TaxID=2951999 RepID=UPI002D64B896|nr:TolC family protein [Alloacidobacterium sp.]HYK37315.1 TolC family protein [Alloacidobacterium sp.]
MRVTIKRWRRHIHSGLLAGSIFLVPAANLLAQIPATTGANPTSIPSPYQISTPQQSGSGFQGSVVEDKPVEGVLPLSLDDAIQRGLKHNLGYILTAENTTSVNGSRLQELQELLPTVKAKGEVSVQQVNLAAEGLRVPGFPTIIGPFGFTDIRASLDWSLLNIASLRNYLAAKHNFEGSKLSVDDARDMVTLTVGNTYLLVIADKSRVESAQAQVDTSKVSLDQAVQNHQAGTAPLLDELRARVDYQTQQQTLITAQNQLEKDRISLARVIGLPLEQKFELTDQAPYTPLDNIDPDTAVKEAFNNRSDLKAMAEQLKSAEKARAAATAERYPTISFSGDYGDIGVNPANSHGTGDATGTMTIPVLEEGKLRGDAQQAQAQLETKRAQFSDLHGQISADVRDSILDIRAAQQQVEVSRSNVQLANEALSEAQQRYAAGVSDNLAVSQAQQSVAQANDQYVSSLYQHNIAKLSLARALGVAQKSYKSYVGGK